MSKEKISLYFLKRLIKEYLSQGVHPKPRLIFLGFSSVPKFMISNFIEELCVLQLVGVLNLS
jgi:hypothetical protein